MKRARGGEDADDSLEAQALIINDDDVDAPSYESSSPAPKHGMSRRAIVACAVGVMIVSLMSFSNSLSTTEPSIVEGGTDAGSGPAGKGEDVVSAFGGDPAAGAEENGEGANEDVISTQSLRAVPVVLAVALYAIYAFFFKGTAEQPAAVKVRERKAKLCLAQMAQTLKMEVERAAQEQYCRENNGELPKGDDERKTRPEIEPLFNLLYDRVEERHTTAYGIESIGLEEYRQTLSLFKECLVLELTEGLENSKVADRMHYESEEQAVKLAKYRGGAKLRGLNRFFKKSVGPNFSKPRTTAFGTYEAVVDPHVRSLYEASKKYVAQIDKDNATGKHAIMKVLLPRIPLYGFGMLLFLVESWVGPAMWARMFTLFDKLADGSMSIETFHGVLVTYFVRWIFFILAHVVGSSCMNKANSEFSTNIRNEVMRSMLRQDVEYFDRTPSGVLQERLNKDAAELAQHLFEEPKTLLRCIAVIISNLMVLYQIDRRLMTSAFLPVPVVVCTQYVMIKFIRTLGRRLRNMSERAAADTAEIIKELRTVREFAKEDSECDKFTFTSSYRAQIEEFGNAIRNICFGWPLFLIFMGNRMFAMSQGGRGVLDQSLTIGVAIQFTVCVNILSDHLRIFIEALPQLIKMMDPFDRVNELLTAKGRIEPQPGDAPKLTAIHGTLEFKDVDFAVPDKKILSKMNFKVEPGMTVGFCGAAGCGKSTSINLIKRFYNPTSGEILLGGRPLADYDLHALRRHISVVSQENVLFSSTIRENIIYGLSEEEKRAPDIEARIEAACRKASIWDDIQTLFPRKLESFVGEKGFKMSGGQKQRIAIARAMIRNPTFLILDEPTSALDSVNEKVIQDALDKMMAQNKQGSTLMIAHRLTTLKKCDRIFVMNKGHIMEAGTHEELLEIEITKETKDDGTEVTLTGWYRELWETQNGKTSSHGDVSDTSAHTHKWIAHLEAKVRALESSNRKLRRDLAHHHKHHANPWVRGGFYGSSDHHEDEHDHHEGPGHKSALHVHVHQLVREGSAGWADVLGAPPSPSRAPKLSESKTNMSTPW